MSLTDHDKVLHSKGGLAVCVFALFMAAAMHYLGAHAVTTAVATASVAVALAIEGMQWVENRGNVAPKREVSALDAFATAYPGLILAAVFELVVRHVILASVLA